MPSLRPHNNGDRAGAEDRMPASRLWSVCLPQSASSKHQCPLFPSCPSPQSSLPLPPREDQTLRLQYRNSSREAPWWSVVKAWPDFTAEPQVQFRLGNWEIPKLCGTAKNKQIKSKIVFKKKERKKEIAPVNKVLSRPGEGMKIPKAACFSSPRGNYLHHPPPQFSPTPTPNPSSSSRGSEVRQTGV